MGGSFSRRLGLPRSFGQIYCLLLLSPKPLALDDIVTALKISKASTSTGTRQLAAWGAIRQVWVPGERRDFVEAVPDLLLVIRTAFHNFLEPRIQASQRHLHGLLAGLDAEVQEGIISREEFAQCTERAQKLLEIHQKIQQAAPLLEHLL